MRLNYVIVFVSDMNRAIAFYRDALGLPLRFESSGWTEFAGDRATLALHAGGESTADAGTPLESQPGQCRPGLSVENLDEFHERMVARGMKCVQAPSETFGARVAQYADPDGLVISVGQERRAGTSAGTPPPTQVLVGKGDSINGTPVPRDRAGS